MLHKIAKICQTILILFCCGYGLFCIWSSNAGAETIHGQARVIDGDTIEVNGEKIRLACIDTPESNYRGKTQYCLDNETDCGMIAKKVLWEAVNKNGGEVICEYTKRDVYGRILGFCQEYQWNYQYNYEGTFNYRMVYWGYAWYYDGGKECKPYKEAFENAYRAGIGLFEGSEGGFKEPKLWRKTRSND